MPFRRCSRSSKRPIEYSRTSVWPNLSPISLYVSKCDCFTILLSVTRFSKAPETFQACKAIFSSSVSAKNGEVSAPETSCMKGTCVHIKHTRIKQLCHHKVRGFFIALRARKSSVVFEKRASGHDSAAVWFQTNWRNAWRNSNTWVYNAGKTNRKAKVENG